MILRLPFGIEVSLTASGQKIRPVVWKKFVKLAEGENLTIFVTRELGAEEELFSYTVPKGKQASGWVTVAGEEGPA